MSRAHHDIKAWLADHPRLTAAAFTAMVLLSQAGAVLAKEGSDLSGP